MSEKVFIRLYASGDFLWSMEVRYPPRKEDHIVIMMGVKPRKFLITSVTWIGDDMDLDVVEVK